LVKNNNVNKAKTGDASVVLNANEKIDVEMKLTRGGDIGDDTSSTIGITTGGKIKLIANKIRQTFVTLLNRILFICITGLFKNKYCYQFINYMLIFPFSGLKSSRCFFSKNCRPFLKLISSGSHNFFSAWRFFHYH
jgi:hypothetical protein